MRNTHVGLQGNCVIIFLRCAATGATRSVIITKNGNGAAVISIR